MTEHPITPPPELVREWIGEANHNEPMFAQVAVMGAQWGADRELEECCEHLKRIWSPSNTIDSLRNARRPKPPSLKEQALALLQPGEPRLFNNEMQDTLRRALEALDD